MDILHIIIAPVEQNSMRSDSSEQSQAEFQIDIGCIATR